MKINELLRFNGTIIRILELKDDKALTCESVK